jgi:PAS domain-containing protein
MEKRHLLAWQPNNEEKQRSFLRAIIDNISDLVLAKDLDGRFYFRQPRAPGWMRAVRVVARVRFIHVGNSAWLRRERQAGHRERPCDNRRRDHTLPWLHAAVPLKVFWLMHGELRRIIGVARQITAREVAAIALKRSQMLYRGIL